MVRWLTVLLLIATIVACPYRCGGAFGEACAAETTAKATKAPAPLSPAPHGCRCCRHEPAPEPQSEEPNEPLPGPCECASCVCEGAVLPEKVSFVADDSASVPTAATLLLAISLQGSQVESIRGAVPEPEPSSGRTLRVLHRSLLL